MPTISTTDAQGLFTKMVIDVYKERSKPTKFLRAFFPTVVSPTLEISWEVQRNSEYVADDVVRGADGNRNEFGRSTEKLSIPPYFREWFDATQLQLYDRLYGATQIDDAIFAAYVNNVVDAQQDIVDLVDRAYELQCAQVLQTGIVTTKRSGNFDFKRKPESKVDLGTTGSNGVVGYWATSGIDVFKQLEGGCNFIRKIGKSGAGFFNLLCGSAALNDLLTNDVFLKRQNLFSMALDAVAAPIRNAEGATYHGTITCGSYKVALWAYPQYYDIVTGGVKSQNPYLDPNYATLIPENPRFKLSHAAVPQLLTPNTPPAVGAYIFGEYIDRRSKSHVMDVESAGLAVPIAVDTIWTAKVR